MAETLGSYLLLSSALFAVGLFGVLLRRNLVAMLIGVELMLNAVIINLVAFARFAGADPGNGQVFALFVIGVAAAEAAVGLSIILTVFKARGAISVDRLEELSG
ncbi:MAG: NADH-quinone oxidoreductase subunit NuoK [Rickettsiales bacterium]|nr:NADH-quinone oxidoreductase subunit NuoK [Rickettsiales bacterium]